MEKIIEGLWLSMATEGVVYSERTATGKPGEGMKINKEQFTNIASLYLSKYLPTTDIKSDEPIEKTEQ